MQSLVGKDNETLIRNVSLLLEVRTPLRLTNQNHLQTDQNCKKIHEQQLLQSLTRLQMCYPSRTAHLYPPPDSVTSANLQYDDQWLPCVPGYCDHQCWIHYWKVFKSCSFFSVQQVMCKYRTASTSNSWAFGSLAAQCGRWYIYKHSGHKFIPFGRTQARTWQFSIDNSGLSL